MPSIDSVVLVSSDHILNPFSLRWMEERSCQITPYPTDITRAKSCAARMFVLVGKDTHPHEGTPMPTCPRMAHVHTHPGALQRGGSVITAVSRQHYAKPVHTLSHLSLTIILNGRGGFYCCFFR